MDISRVIVMGLSSGLLGLVSCGPVQFKDSALLERNETSYSSYSSMLAKSAYEPLPSGDSAYLHVDADNITALSWDGRLYFGVRKVSIFENPTDAAALTIEAPADKDHPIKLSSEQSAIGDSQGLMISLTENCDIQVRNNATGQVLWNSKTDGWCTNPKLQFQSDGNVILSGHNTKVIDGIQDINYHKTVGIWATGRQQKDTVKWTLHTKSPYFVAWNAAGQVRWSGNSQTGKDSVPISSIGVVRAEHLDRTPPKSLADLGTLVHDAFSPGQDWLMGRTTIPDRGNFPSAIRLPIMAPAFVTVTPEKGYAENPYRSNATGIPSDGDFITYKLRVFMTDYTIDDHKCLFPENRQYKTPITSVGATVVVSNPYTDQAEVASYKLDGSPVRLTDVNGDPLCGIEPTLTTDRKLLVWNGAGRLTYSFNPTVYTNTGWTAQRSLADLYQDQFKGSATANALRTKGYGIARYPVVKGTGVPYKSPQANPYPDDPSKPWHWAQEGGVPGAYPWLSADGTDLFFTSIASFDSAMRAGEAVAGASTHGMLKMIDGGLNTSRHGYPEVLATSSFGRMPGMWSPLEHLQHSVLPMTDKLFTYPIFASNNGRYTEVSFEESLVGDYDLYLEMNEGVHGNWIAEDISYTPDSSGHFHYAKLQAGAAFPEEAYPYPCTEANPCPLQGKVYDLPTIYPPSANLCGLFVCPMLDPQSPDYRGYSGKFMTFSDAGFLTVDETSPTGHRFLRDAQQITVSFAIKPLENLANVRQILNRDDSFEVYLDVNRRVNFAVSLLDGHGKISRRESGARGDSLPANAWTHVAFTYHTGTGKMQFYVNGLLNWETTFGSPSPLNTSLAPLIVGPKRNGGVSGYVYALDQVAVSRVVRTPDEIARQAHLRLRRDRADTLAKDLPAGLSPKDVKSPVLLASEAPNRADRERLGKTLFSSKLLSEDGKTSCASCHVSGRAFTDGLAFHDSRTPDVGGARLLRNVPSLNNLAFKTTYFTDGRAATLEDQAHTVLMSAPEMGHWITPILPKLSADATIKAQFESAYPGVGVTQANLLNALTSYELTLTSGDSLYDRYRAGNQITLLTSQINGMKLFFGKARCAECHAGTALTDTQFHDLPFLSLTSPDGKSDLGRQSFTNSPDDYRKFATPSLRNVSRTGPYFHDASSKTLEEVVNRYNSVTAISAATANIDGQRGDHRLQPINLTQAEVCDLASFLRSLTGTNAGSGPDSPVGSGCQ